MSENEKGGTTGRAISVAVRLALTGYWALETGYCSYNFSKNSQAEHEI